MTAIPTKLYDAFEKIRLGKVDEGVRLFDRVDGFETAKYIALAELSYFRHDWKHGIQFAHEFLNSDFDLNTTHRWGNSVELHFELFLLATCQLGCWKESRSFLEQRKRYYKTVVIQNTIAMISDPQNTTQRLLESRPKLRTSEKDKYSLLSLYEHQAKNGEILSGIHSKRKSYWKRSYDNAVSDLYRKAKTEDHITFYERHVEHFENAESHSEAAKSYIALENPPAAKNAIKRYMGYWKFKEPHQVAPIILFTDHELWPVMADRHFTESLLIIPHNNES